MPPKSLAPDNKVIVDRTTNTIVLTRTFTAPREDVFEAWTQPEHVACWWDASGAPLSLCEIDLRPDGALVCIRASQTFRRSAASIARSYHRKARLRGNGRNWESPPQRHRRRDPVDGVDHLRIGGAPGSVPTNGR